MTTPLLFWFLLDLGIVLLFLGISRLVPAFKRINEGDGLILLAKGARLAISGAALVVIAISLRIDHDGLFWFGVAFLFEELYETTMVLGIMRWHVKHELNPVA